MSEICFDCLNKTLGGNERPEKYVYSKDMYICEDCGQFKHTVLAERNAGYYIRKLRFVFYPVVIICFPLVLIYSLVIRLYLKSKMKKKRRP